MQEKSLLDYVTEQSNKPRPEGFVPIWRRIVEEMADAPEEVLAQLPTDGAENHDHYLYGWPKRSEKGNK